MTTSEFGSALDEALSERSRLVFRHDVFADEGVQLIQSGLG